MNNQFAISSPLQTKQFVWLGKMLVIKKPEIAHELFQLKPTPAKAIETDLSKIAAFYKSFLKSYSEPDCHQRKVFVAAMICLYNPGTRLLLKHIWNTLNQDKSYTAKIMNEVEFRYRKVEEFKTEVDLVIEKLRNAC